MIRVLTTDAASLRDGVRTNDPDVVCVTGAPRWLRWRSRSAKLARDAGLLYVTGIDAASGRLLLAPLRTRVVDVTVRGGEAVALVQVGEHQAAVATGPVDSPYDAPLIICTAPGLAQH